MLCYFGGRGGGDEYIHGQYRHIFFPSNISEARLAESEAADSLDAEG